MRVYELRGTPRDMGRAFGESARDETRALYRLRVDNAIAQAKTYGGRTVGESTLLDVARASLPIVGRYSPAAFDELEGIAEGAGLGVERVWAMNALTDLRDVVAFGTWSREAEGCSSFIVLGDRAADGNPLLGQSWDLATDNMPFVCIVRRKPVDAPATVCLTLTGCLSLIGMNAAGISIGNTNLRTTDSRPGVGYLDVIHNALSKTTLDEVVAAVEDAPRAGAHYYYAMDALGRGLSIECTARQHRRLPIDGGSIVHCNHMHAEPLRSLEAPVPADSSHHRQRRMEEQLAMGDLRREDIARALADHDGGKNAICRHDVGGISSNGCVIMSPATRQLWALHGQACLGEWTEFSP